MKKILIAVAVLFMAVSAGAETIKSDKIIPENNSDNSSSDLVFRPVARQRTYYRLQITDKATKKDILYLLNNEMWMQVDKEAWERIHKNCPDAFEIKEVEWALQNREGR